MCMLWGSMPPATASECRHSLLGTGCMVLLTQAACRALHTASLQLRPVPIRQALTFLQVLQIPDKLGVWLCQCLKLINAVKIVIVLDVALHQEEQMSGGACAGEGEQTQATLHAFALQQ